MYWYGGRGGGLIGHFMSCSSSKNFVDAQCLDKSKRREMKSVKNAVTSENYFIKSGES